MLYVIRTVSLFQVALVALALSLVDTAGTNEPSLDDLLSLAGNYRNYRWNPNGSEFYYIFHTQA